MNPLIAYAKIPMSFWNLYRKHRPLGNYTVAIACAMTGILIINAWSVILFASLIDHSWLMKRANVSPAEFGALFLGLFFAETTFVKFVRTKVDRDAGFAQKVKSASPSISIGYAIVSTALLIISTVLALAL